jgi:hypothetical protein
MLIYMTAGSEAPRSGTPEMRAIWESDDESKRTELVQNMWPDFDSEFASLLADIFQRQDKRIKMEALKDDFKAVGIYRC